MELQEFKNNLINGLSFVPNILTVAIYGSFIYKNIDSVRDLDVFVVFDDESMPSGRVDVYIESLNKRASTYLINKKDLYDDIRSQKFASKFAIFFYHGYISLLNEDICYKFYVDSMKSIIKNFDLTLYPDAARFYKEANIKIYRYFPNYVKSGLDFYVYPSLREINYSLYQKSYLSFLLDRATYIKNKDFLRVSYFFVAFFRKQANSAITDINTKKNQILLKLYEFKELIIAEYGLPEYEFLVANVNGYFDEIINFVPENSNMLTLKCYDAIYC